MLEDKLPDTSLSAPSSVIPFLYFCFAKHSFYESCIFMKLECERVCVYLALSFRLKVHICAPVCLNVQNDGVMKKILNILLV